MSSCYICYVTVGRIESVERAMREQPAFDQRHCVLRACIPGQVLPVPSVQHCLSIGGITLLCQVNILDLSKFSLLN